MVEERNSRRTSAPVVRLVGLRRQSEGTDVWAKVGVASALAAMATRNEAPRRRNRGGRRWALCETAVGAGMVTRRAGSLAVPISVVFVSIVPPKPGSSQASPAGFGKLIACRFGQKKIHG